jgi:hypothetical protein
MGRLSALSSPSSVESFFFLELVSLEERDEALVLLDLEAGFGDMPS